MTFRKAEWPHKLRSTEWIGGTSRDHIYHRSRIKNQGLPDSGYARLFFTHVEGADTGADFDFLKGRRGKEVPRDSH